MRIETIEKAIYSYSELSDDAKENALSQWSESIDYGWWDSVYDYAARIAEILGIDLNQKRVNLMNGDYRYDPAICFSGFWSQGDGASYSATFRYAKGMSKKIRQYAPNDTELHRIADSISAIQKRYFYRLSGGVSESRNYSMSITIQNDLNEWQDLGSDESDYLDSLRSFADWIYYALQKEYEYQTSESSFIESCEANGYEFDSNGAMC